LSVVPSHPAGTRKYMTIMDPRQDNSGMTVVSQLGDDKRKLKNVIPAIFWRESRNIMDARQEHSGMTVQVLS